MKPNFTLSLSFDGICLTHIAQEENTVVGTVALDSSTLAHDLAELRSAAVDIEPDGIATKLIIPNDQIRFLSTDPAGASALELPEIARQTLIGATPYAVDDLAYDHCIDAGILRIAAVARETLQEAEGFAAEHGFNPIAFGADTKNTDFIGEPNFEAKQPVARSDVQPDVIVEHLEQPTTPTFQSSRANAITKDDSDSDAISTAAASDARSALSDTVDDHIEAEITPNEGEHNSVGVDTLIASIPPEFEANTDTPPQVKQRRPRNLVLIAACIFGLLLINLAIWTPLFSSNQPAEHVNEDDTGTQDIAALPDEYSDDITPAELSTLPEDAKPLEDVVDTTRRVFSELSSDEARTRYAATGVWQKAPSAPRSPDLSEPEDFYQTSLDPTVPSSDAVALPAVAFLQTDQHPNSTASSSGAGVTFDFDDRGLVIATDYGALTPQGVIVYTGRPTATQPTWPKRHIVGQPKEIDEPFAGLRPRTRPENLSDSFERSTLNGRTLSELAAFRPKIRPKAVEERAISTISPGANPETINTAVAAAIQSSAPDLAPTKEAVTASVMPKQRPRKVEKAARNQQTAAAAQPVSKAQKVTPSLPTSASVTRQATQTNAIKLRQVNLIGVYGTPSSRRALVRLSNGRYKKVTVGDKLDGGKVAAIGKSELRYVKKGRNIVLQMPKG